MNWRPWILAALTVAMAISNAALMYFEDVSPPDAGAGPADRVGDQLMAMRFTAGRRRANMTAMGLPDDLGDRAFDLAGRVWSQHDRLQILLHQNASTVSGPLCNASGFGVHTRYAALSFLVQETDSGDGLKERRLIDWRRTTALEVQDWYGTSLVSDVYERLEKSKPQHGDATVMGIGAVFAGREDDVIERRRPFSGGLTGWSFSRLQSNDPDVTDKIVEYLAVMHVLTELARDEEDGICGG